MNESIPSVSVTYAQSGASTRANELGMRPMQERAFDKRGEQYLLIKSPPASGKSRALINAPGNDNERSEKLFELYTRRTEDAVSSAPAIKAAQRKRA